MARSFILIGVLALLVIALANCRTEQDATFQPDPTPDVASMIATAVAAAVQPTDGNEGQESSPSRDTGQIKLDDTTQLNETPNGPRAQVETPTIPTVPTATPTRRNTPTPTPAPRVVSDQPGSCWSEGESFKNVTDGRGETYAVEPFQLLFLEGGEHVWLCGVLRTGVTPAMVSGRWAPSWGRFEDGEAQGFYRPSGKPIYVNPLDLSQKYWQLGPAQWYRD